MESVDKSDGNEENWGNLRIFLYFINYAEERSSN